MAIAEIRFDYAQILRLARQLPIEERKRLSSELMEEPDKKSWSYIFSLVEPNQDITEEEILAECDTIRNQIYNEAFKNRHRL